MKTQWWLAELDRHGNAKLCDGAHQRREGAEKAATILRRLGLAENRNFAVAEVRLTELTGNHDPVNDEAIDTLNAIGLRPNTGDKPRRMRRLEGIVSRCETAPENNMGCDKTIDAERFPKQGAHWGKQVRVCFNYNTSRTLLGLVVRDDAEEPGRMIIRLEDGRHVLSSECQYQPVDG